MENTMTVSSFIKFGWETFKKRPLMLIFVPILFSILYGFVGGIIGGIVGGIVGSITTEGFGNTLGEVIRQLINVLYWAGYAAFLLKAHDAPEQLKLKDFWQPQSYWRYLGAMVAMLVVIGAGLILFIVPGIIAAIALMFVPYLVVERGLGPIEALKESVRMTKGHRLRLFALLGANILLMIVGLLCFFVGVFVASAVGMLAIVHFYRFLSKQNASAAVSAGDTMSEPSVPTPRTTQPLTGGEKALIAVAVLLPVLFVVTAIMAASFLVKSFTPSLQSAQERAQMENQLQQLMSTSTETR